MVRTGFPGGPRLEWYDRNPVKQDVIMASVDAGPHALIQRAIYTAPSGKKAFIELAWARSVRKTAAGSLGSSHIYLRFRGANNVVMLLYDNNVGACAQFAVGQCATLVTGNAASLHTADDGTGGLINYAGSVTVTEFDA